MQDELIRLQRELKKTIIFISHDIQESLKLGDRVAIMKDGYMVQVGTPQEIITNPVNDYIREFVQDVNRAQVLTTGSIARRTRPFKQDNGAVQGSGSVQAALRHMNEFDRQRMFVLDSDHRPVGLVLREEIEAAASRGVDSIESVMMKDFSTAHAAMSLEEIFHIAQDGIPLAVVDDQGRFEGMIEPTDIFASISGKTATARVSSTPQEQLV
jgi:glycine betaine/proline transport system ATP-binding protein